MRRLDRNSGLPHRPATAIADEIAAPTEDSYSVALWRAHIERALRAAKTLRARFSDLARQPLGRRVAGHRKPQQLPTFVAENEKREQLLKRNRRNHEQINRRDPLH